MRKSLEELIAEALWKDEEADRRHAEEFYKEVGDGTLSEAITSIHGTLRRVDKKPAKS